MLLLALCRLGTLDGTAVESRFEELDVMRIGAAHFDAQRYATSVGQDGSFDAEFPAVRRVFPGFFPRPAVTW